MTFTFDIAKAESLLNHSLRSCRHRSLYGLKQTAKPGLFLIKDVGVYLLSNGDPGMRAGNHVRAVYAKGHDGTRCDGNDFAEFVSARNLKTIFRRAASLGKRTFRVTVTKTRIRLMV
jgi:Protein of unknown function (DUF3085)